MLVQDELLQFISTELAVFVGHTDVCFTAGKIRGITTFKGNLDACLALQRFKGDVRKDFGLNVGGDGLGKVAQGFSPGSIPVIR